MYGRLPPHILAEIAKYCPSSKLYANIVEINTGEGWVSSIGVYEVNLEQVGDPKKAFIEYKIEDFKGWRNIFGGETYHRKPDSFSIIQLDQNGKPIGDPDTEDLLDNFDAMGDYDPRKMGPLQRIDVDFWLIDSEKNLVVAIYFTEKRENPEKRWDRGRGVARVISYYDLN